MAERSTLRSTSLATVGRPAPVFEGPANRPNTPGRKPADAVFKVTKGERRRLESGKPIEVPDQVARFSMAAACLTPPEDPATYGELSRIMGAIMSCCGDDPERGEVAARALVARGWTIPPRGRAYYKDPWSAVRSNEFENEEERTCP